MKLELKHLAPYLPYGLKIVWQVWFSKTEHRDSTHVMHPMELHNWDVDNGYVIIPIFRPLSDLTKEIEVNRECFIPSKELSTNKFDAGYTWNYYAINANNVKLLNYEIIEKLFEWHFDVFGLIEKGLAIDINTL